MEVLEGIDFDVLEGEQFVYFLVQLGTFYLVADTFLVVKFKMLVDFVGLLLLEEVVVEFVYPLEGEQVFYREEAYHFLLEFGEVKNELQLWVLEVDHFFGRGRLHPAG